MAKAVKLPSGNYRVRLNITDPITHKVTRPSFTAPTKEEALLLANEYLIDYRINGTFMDNRVRLGTAFDSYINTMWMRLSPTTIRHYQSVRRRRFQSIMNMPISSINSKVMQRAINEELENGISPAVVRSNYGVIKRIILKHNPRIILDVTLPRVIPNRGQLPPVEDVIRAVKGTDIELPCMLSIWLSLSMSEIFGLKWDDIIDGYLYVHRSRVRVDGVRIEKDYLKTQARTRALRIPEYIQKLLDETPRVTEWIVNFTDHQLYKRFQKYTKRAGVPHLRYHQLRHMSASVMVVLHVPDKYAQDRGGWATDTVMKTVYQHTFDAQRREVDDKIDRYFDAILAKTDTESGHENE